MIFFVSFFHLFFPQNVNKLANEGQEKKGEKKVSRANDKVSVGVGDTNMSSSSLYVYIVKSTTI